MDSLLSRVYYKNTVEEYLIALSIIVVGTLLLRIFAKIFFNSVSRWAASTSGTVDDVIISKIKRFGVAALQYAIIYWGINYLELSLKARNVVDTATSVVIAYFVIRLISSLILILLQNRIRRQDRGEEKIKQLGGLMIIINILIWIVGIVFLLDNLGKDVTTIITGLGIGGIAIALAAQNILGDLFNYFVIFFDRPFEAGDFITVDDKAGTVEYVGIKTTRIRSLSGEQIIIGNSNLTGSRIHNFKRLVNRRIVFTLNLDYRTPLEKLKIVPTLIKSIVEKQNPVMFDRAHFSSFGDWSLKVEVVYLVLDPDFNKYMDIQQNINLEIAEVLAQHEIYFVAGVHVSMAPLPPASPVEVNKEEAKL
jgi:small-conductance mechanosensitive channel